MRSLPRPLMVALVVVVLDERLERSSQVAFPEGNHSTETLVLDRAHKSLGVSVRVGRLKRGLHDSDPRRRQELPNRRRPFPVAIADQHAMANQRALIRSGERATDLAHERVVGIGRRAHDLHAA